MAIDEIVTDANPNQIAAFLVLMRAKGETVEELQGIIEAMRAKMVQIQVSSPVLDIVGTGGDGAHTLNISTASAILAASCGAKIGKHGNRSVSSLCGSADVLESLGINIHLEPEKVGLLYRGTWNWFYVCPQLSSGTQKHKRDPSRVEYALIL